MVSLSFFSFFFGVNFHVGFHAWGHFWVVEPSQQVRKQRLRPWFRTCQVKRFQFLCLYPGTSSSFSESLTFSRQLPDSLRILTTWYNFPEHSYFVFHVFFALSSGLSSCVSQRWNALSAPDLCVLISTPLTRPGLLLHCSFFLLEGSAFYWTLLWMWGPSLAFSTCEILYTLQNCLVHMPQAGLWDLIPSPSLMKLQWLLTAYNTKHGFLSLSSSALDCPALTHLFSHSSYSSLLYPWPRLVKSHCLPCSQKCLGICLLYTFALSVQPFSSPFTCFRPASWWNFQFRCHLLCETFW